MGLPEIIIQFQRMGQTMMQRSQRGIVACILPDSGQGPAMSVYTSLQEVDYTAWTAANYKYLELVFMGQPYKVIAIRVADSVVNYDDALQRLQGLRWNYLTIPGIQAEQLPVVTAWIKEQRDRDRKTFKAVLPKTAGDHESIINFTTDTIKITDGDTTKDFTCAEYCARIAGLLAGLPLSRSCTYYPLEEIISADIPIDPNARIDAGELVLVFDSEKFLIGRGVNSLVTVSSKSADLKKITIMEKRDLYQEDIQTIFRQEYLGQVVNDYDNKQAFVAAVKGYHKELLGDVLNRTYDHTAQLNLTAQLAWLKEQGVDVTDMSDQDAARADTGSRLFVTSNVKFVDAMEDLDMITNM